MYRTPRTMRSARFGFREEPEEKEEHRASVMPEHMPSVDPIFLDGVFRMFTPEEKGMVEEKAGGAGMIEKPKTFYAVSSEEAVKEGRLPLAFFEFREDAELYLNHALQTGIITEWMIDRPMENQTKENLVAVAMRIVTDRLKAPALLESLRECADYVKQEINSLVECQTNHGTGQIDHDDLACINMDREILARAEAAIAKAEDRR